VTGQYEVSFPGMDQAVSEAKAHAAQITQILEDMNSQTQSQLDYWVGSAKDEYNSTYAICYQVAQALPRAVDAARQTLENINTTLVDAENSNSKIFASGS
jgi:WXG100 family type VII secretion target